jgi:DinB family protein
LNANDYPQVRFAEALELLAAMPVFVEAAVESAEPGALRQRPSEDAFSLVEQACHLRDLEREGYLVRVRRMLTEHIPALEGFDGATVAAARDYPAQDGVAAAHDFARARRELVTILSALTPADLAREAEFGGRRICLADLVAMVVDHDRGHRDEITALLEAREP